VLGGANFIIAPLLQRMHQVRRAGTTFIHLMSQLLAWLLGLHWRSSAEQFNSELLHAVVTIEFKP